MTVLAAPAARRRVAGLATVSVAGLAIGLAAFAGHLAAGVRGAAPSAHALSAGPIELVVPQGWRVQRAAPPLGGLVLEDPMATRAPDGRGLAVAGALPGVVFPQDLGRSVDPAAGEPDGVRLGRFEAYRWRGLDGRDGPLTLLAAPTGMGAAVIACSGSGDAIRRCERAAATLKVEGSSPTALDTLAFYASHLDGALGRLQRRHRSAAARLRTASAGADQAAAATRLALAHRSAARSLGDLAPPAAAARANEALVEELRGIDTAYGELARAARRGRRAAYEGAARSVERRERGLRDALGRMVPPAA